MYVICVHFTAHINYVVKSVQDIHNMSVAISLLRIRPTGGARVKTLGRSPICEVAIVVVKVAICAIGHLLWVAGVS